MMLTLIKLSFVFLGITVRSSGNNLPPTISEIQECGALNTQVQNCWGGDFILEPPSCEEKSALLSCAESLQQEIFKCPNSLVLRVVLDSVIENYEKIIKKLCKYPTLVEDFKTYNNCWSLYSLCAKPLSVVVNGLVGPLSCRYAEESVGMCLTAHLVSFQGNPFHPHQCPQSHLADQFVQIVYDSVACGKALKSKGFHYGTLLILSIISAITTLRVN